MNSSRIKSEKLHTVLHYSRSSSSMATTVSIPEGTKSVTIEYGVSASTKRIRTDPPATAETYVLPDSYAHPDATVNVFIKFLRMLDDTKKHDTIKKAFDAKKLNESRLPELLKKGEEAPDWFETHAELKDRWYRIGDSDVRKFLSGFIKEMHGIDLPTRLDGEGESGTSISFTTGCIVVPTRCPNSHNYTIGVPIVNKDGTRFYQFGSKEVTGNSLTNKVNCLRLPTIEEYIAVVLSLV